ncbi:UDP-N-acetylmuramoyl-tripeptide--D-alanyl-D-alanine ligase [Chitinophaga skermanii]|uniref:UDP-N-acetylmuramoyl-tripeptide--D-alanyl-D-alanine ligase n=1 Tax=Chitinophaga skermanii TaxID=331697 RepID=A0A327QJD1_9BACT|nr:UDP-N-acetylmuramoyl-tripeptide--D-alanyl-D-alanine ligase [Chitinophaga skermanii]RAJ04105.1 UDP-N-acetylmuramoyl-tripeptide--D-alanyl-D-alanine ligase [Chitinophaga skermanii]
MTISALYDIYLQNPSIQTDTRKLKQGDLFFALKGPNFDGNTYAANALAAGARAAIIDDKAYFIDADKTILVDDVLTTLQKLAEHHRLQFNIPFIGITGTNGKTTTKELINAVLSQHFKTVATVGNLNNHIGVPLTLLSIPAGTEMAIIEMGANHEKEIEGYCKVAHPTHVIITNIGKAHLEGFGSVEGVKRAKGELYDYARANKGTAFVCNDLSYLVDMSAGIAEVVTYGKGEADYSGEPVPGKPLLEVSVKNIPGLESIQTNLVGDYNYTNVLAAVTVGSYFKVPVEKIHTALSNYTPSNNRSQVMQIGSNTIIMDAYNANPSSMKAAIDNFASLHATKKVLLLGAMRELGENSVAEHQAVVDLLETQHWHAVVLVGGDFEHVRHPYIYLPDAMAAKTWLQQQQFEEAHILIKGSRGIGMERVIEA